MSGFLDNTQINYVFEKEGREEGGEGGGPGGEPLAVSPGPFLVPRPAVHLGVSSMHLLSLGTKAASRGLAREAEQASLRRNHIGGIGARAWGQALCGGNLSLVKARSLDLAACILTLGAHLYASLSSTVKRPQAYGEDAVPPKGRNFAYSGLLSPGHLEQCLVIQ